LQKKLFAIAFVALYIHTCVIFNISLAQTVLIDTRLPSVSASSIGLALTIILPDTPRYDTCGAPLVINIPGGWEGEGYGALNSSNNYTSLGFIAIVFNFPGSGGGPHQSGGIYDMRGPNCLQALSDVIAFANDEVADNTGQTISQLIAPWVSEIASIGLLGNSNGGNIILCTIGNHADSITKVDWIVNWESPVGDGMPGAVAGAWGSGPFYNNPIVNPAYNDTTGEFDFSLLAYSDTLICSILPLPVGVIRGNFYFDINQNTIPDPGIDYIPNPIIHQLNQSVNKAMWSVGLMHAADSIGLIPFPPPQHMPSVGLTDNFWLVRNGENWIDTIVTNFPDILFIVLASDTDHVQSAPDYPHILRQYELFQNSGAAMTRINPDASYVEILSGTSFPGIVDNPANIVFDHLTIRSAVEPESIPSEAMKKAALAELADRNFMGILSIQLDTVEYECPPVFCSIPTNIYTSNITPTSARLNWDTTDRADHYQIQGRRTGNSNWTLINISSGEPNFKNVYGLSNNNTYEWQIRTWCDVAESEASDWSALDSFTTNCLTPDTIWTDPITSNAARLNWSQVASAAGYEIKGRKVGTTGLTTILVNNVSSKDVYGLLSAMAYEWEIRTWCDQSGNNKSDFTAFTTFITASNFRKNDHDHNPILVSEAILVFPNPSQGYFMVKTQIEFSELVEIEIRDLNNRIVRNLEFESIASNEMFNQSFDVDVKDFSKGLYFIVLRSGGEVYTGKVLVE